MHDKRKHLQDRIKSARTWLKKAEHSLEKDKDIEGDLNVMLAQAELQRAREIEGKMSTYGIFRLKKYVGIVIIVFVLTSYFLYTHQAINNKNVTVFENTFQKKELLKAEKIDIKPTREKKEQEALNTQNREEKITISTQTIEKENLEKKFQPAEKNDQSLASKEEILPSKMPSLAMQKLMNKAVKNLHAE